MSTGAGVKPSNVVVEKLKQKHPTSRSQTGVTDDELMELAHFTVSEEMLLVADWKEVREIIRKSHNMKAHGVDMLRYEHLKQLVGSTPEPSNDELEFSKRLAEI